MEETPTISQRFGLHPFVAIGMIAIDLMVFGPAEAVATGTAPATAGATLLVTEGALIVIAAVLTIPSVLIQKYIFKDNWGGAIGKGLLVGLLTAIPTPLPVFITGGLGILGGGKILLAKKEEKRITP